MVDYLDAFGRDGFTIVNALRRESLDSLKSELAAYLVEKYNISTIQPIDSETILNNFHALASVNSDKVANKIVLDLLKDFLVGYDFAQIAHDCFSDYISNIVGLDLHAQKGNNIVFQFPGSMRFSELHTDTPPNSPFEIVIWIPLVDCYDSKSFFLVPRDASKKLLTDYKRSSHMNWNEFRNMALQNCKHVNVRCGQAIIFWAGLLHGSNINVTHESRWCLNVRFKHLFAPSGKHDPLTYYKVFKTSALTKMGVSTYE